MLVKGSELPRSGPACGATGRRAVYTRLEKYTKFIQTTINGGRYTCNDCHVNGGDSCTALDDDAPQVEPTAGCGAYRQVDPVGVGGLTSVQIVLISFGVLAALALGCTIYSRCKKPNATERQTPGSAQETELRPTRAAREMFSDPEDNPEYSRLAGTVQFPRVDIITEKVIPTSIQHKTDAAPQRAKKYGAKGDELETKQLTADDGLAASMESNESI